MYDFSNDSIEAEHADVTFKSMEDGLRHLRDALLQREFADWQEHIGFLLPYMQMIRVRSLQFFVEQGQAVADSFIGRVTSVDEVSRKITYDASQPLTEDEVHDGTLTKMREEFLKGSAWMADFHWQFRTTQNPYNPVVTSEQPLFVKGEKTQTERSMTMDILTDAATEVYFPFCWRACLVGRVEPFSTDVEPFEQFDLEELRHMVAKMAPEYVISPQIVEGLKLDGRPLPGVLTRGWLPT